MDAYRAIERFFAQHLGGRSEDRADRPAPRYRWVVLAVGMIAQGSFAALLLGLAAIAEQIRDEFGLSIAAVGAILAAPTFGSIATVLAWGALADRIGERAVIAVGLAGAAGVVATSLRDDSGVALGAGPGGRGGVRVERQRGERPGGGVVVRCLAARHGARPAPHVNAARRGHRRGAAAAWRRRGRGRGGLPGAGGACLAGGSAAASGLRRPPPEPGERRRAAAARRLGRPAARPGDLDGVARDAPAWCWRRSPC